LYSGILGCWGRWNGGVKEEELGAVGSGRLHLYLLGYGTSAPVR
jgi:hypothetical protein